MTAGGDSPAGVESVGHGMVRGAAWMILMRLAVRGAGLINMMIVARLLAPEDFGLLAMAMIFVGAVELFSEFNFDVVLIKDQRAGRLHYDTAWTLSIIRGVAMAGLLLLMAAPAAALFGDPRLEAIVAVLSISSLLLGFQNVGVVDFRKTLDFRKDFLFMAGAKAASVVCTIALALVWRNYWALVFGVIGGKLFRLAASYAMHPYRPALALGAWRELFAFTKWLLLHNILLFLRSRADRFVIGKLLGATTLGVYSIAYDLANLVTTELMAPIRRALLPGYAMLAKEGDRMRSMFIEIFALTLWIGAPVSIGIGLLSEPLIHVLLGDGWAAAVPIAQLLVIAGFFALLSSGSHPVFLALGRPEIQTYLTGLGALLVMPAVGVAASRFGVLGAAAAVAAVQTLAALVDFILVCSLLRLDVRALGPVCWRSLSALALMAVAVEMTTRAWPFDRVLLGQGGLLIAAVFAGGLVYLSTSLLLWRLFGAGQGPERHVWRVAAGTLATTRAKLKLRPVAPIDRPGNH